MAEKSPGAWVEKCMRWGQINLREVDPQSMDVGWWKDYWRRTHVDAIVINAGGIYAYYPTEIPYHERSRWLGERDLFGELVAAAKELGLRVLGRIDPGSAGEALYLRHPDWFYADADGKPFVDRVGQYRTCPNGPYYGELIPRVMREVLARYDVDGFFGNQWFFPSRARAICHCPHCARLFKEHAGLALPVAQDWGDVRWRRWVEWRYARMREVWVGWDQLIKSIIPHGIWLGNVGGHLEGIPQSGLDRFTLGEAAEMMQNDLQGRKASHQLWAPGEQGRIMNATGHGKPHATLVGSYYTGSPYWRLAAQVPAEQQVWLAGVVAGDSRPWWHTIGGVQEDMRFTHAVEDFFSWHKAHERYLRDRKSIANVGLVYSPRTIDYYGREKAYERVVEGFRGMYFALLTARVPFDVVHERSLDAASLARYDALILPNVACLGDAECAQVLEFVRRGGGLLSTYETSLYDEEGGLRSDYGLAAAFGVHWLGEIKGPLNHSYMRVETRHPVLKGFEETSILANGGQACISRPAGGTETVLTLIPPFPTHPPETAWMRSERTDTPLLCLSEALGGRSAYFAGDVERLFWRTNLPDHAQLLDAALRWVMRKPGPVQVSGPGLLDVHAYRQEDAVVVHLVNLTNPSLWKGPCHQLIDVGPQVLEVALPSGARATEAKLLVAGAEVSGTLVGDRVQIRVPSVLAHEVVVIPLGV